MFVLAALVELDFPDRRVGNPDKSGLLVEDDEEADLGKVVVTGCKGRVGTSGRPAVVGDVRRAEAFAARTMLGDRLMNEGDLPRTERSIELLFKMSAFCSTTVKAKRRHLDKYKSTLALRRFVKENVRLGGHGEESAPSSAPVFIKAQLERED